jgi:methylenetetrahydrofolate reductase (NADPH)
VAGPLAPAQFEVLPFPRAEEEARELPEPARLTVTSSPRHGPERTVEYAVRLTELGHRVTPHLSARAIRDAAHLDELLERISAAGIDGVFVIGGDDREPAGSLSSAGELLSLIREKPHGVRTIGIAAYPEGHPLIDAETLEAALEAKSAHADYMTTQLCFDAGTLLDWLRASRRRGITLPVRIGLPGVVDRKRLLEVSMRIGVGPSVSYVRKQRGILQLLRRPSSLANKLFDGLADCLAERELGITGFHYFTLNQLIDTWTWDRDKSAGARLVVGS